MIIFYNKGSVEDIATEHNQHITKRFGLNIVNYPLGTTSIDHRVPTESHSAFAHQNFQQSLHTEKQRQMLSAEIAMTNTYKMLPKDLSLRSGVSD